MAAIQALPLRVRSHPRDEARALLRCHVQPAAEQWRLTVRGRMRPPNPSQESRLKKTILAAIAVQLSATCGLAAAQSYEFRHGYVFEQPYVERISISRAEEIAGIPKLFEPLMSFEWTQRKEDIRDNRVRRVGNRLVLARGDGGTLSLKNFSTQRGDADSQSFKYLMGVPGYHLVGVEYGHDQPQYLLVAESGGKIYFVNTN